MTAVSISSPFKFNDAAFNVFYFVFSFINENASVSLLRQPNENC